jgi:anti-sigma regulatory factor (Ser/Thr protein kinase)
VTGSVVLSLLPVTLQPRAAWDGLLPVATTAPARARDDTRFFLGRCEGGSDDLTETAIVLISELVTNSYIAMTGTCATPIEFSLRLFDDHLLIEVIDSSPEPPVLKSPELTAIGGRGLSLVDSLSDEWGYFWHRDRKVVYCTLLIPHGKRDKETED